MHFSPFEIKACVQSEGTEAVWHFVTIETVCTQQAGQ